jgi:citrate synthase
MRDDPETKIARPRQVYVGERDREFVPIGHRGDETEITGPAQRPAGA